jgi:hypothetical protein
MGETVVVSNVVELHSYVDVGRGTQRKPNKFGPLENFRGVWVSHNGLLATVNLDDASPHSWRQHQYHETFHVDKTATKTDLEVPTTRSNATALAFTLSQFFCAEAPKQMHKVIRKGVITATFNASQTQNQCAMLGETRNRHSSLIVGRHFQKTTHSLDLIKRFVQEEDQKFPIPAVEAIQNVITLNMFDASTFCEKDMTIFDFNMLCPLGGTNASFKKAAVRTHRLLWVGENLRGERNLCYISTTHDPISNNLRVYSNKLSLKKHF